jgi:hypothetical protein
MTDETRQSPTPTASHDDADDCMVKIEDLIAELQSVKDQFGNTCVYVRRGGMAWGAVALNRRDDDRKHGEFDLQAQHDRDMLARAEQVERLIEARKRAEQETAAIIEKCALAIEAEADATNKRAASLPGDMSRAIVESHGETYRRAAGIVRQQNTSHRREGGS